MRKLLIPIILLLLSFVGIDGCKKCFPRNTCISKKQTITLDPAANVAVSGQSVTLSNNSTSQTNGFSLTFSNVGSLTCYDVSIDITAAYGFVPNGSSFIPSPITSTMPQYTCAKTDSNIVLSSAPPLTEGFHPWLDNFNIKIGHTVFTVTVNTPASPTQLLTRGAQSSMNLDSSFTGCGLRGTVLQRVFDCSKKIINYAVYVDATSSASNSTTTNSDGTSTYYTLFTNPNTQNSDLFWFVIGCPNTGGSSTVPQQSCTWLTPIVPAGNPALDVGPGVPTFQLALLTGYQKRLLLSGKMTNGTTGYNFAQSNGFVFNNTNEVYLPVPTTANPGTTPSFGQPVHTSPSVCIATTGQSLQGSGTFPASDASIRNIVSISSGATISLQMMSYAMQNILTGGTQTEPASAPACPVTGGTQGRPICNTPAVEVVAPFTNEGFSAINIPSFSMTNSSVGPPNLEMLWSSSSSGVSGNAAWSFAALGGLVILAGPNVNLLGVRCASLAWY